MPLKNKLIKLVLTLNNIQRIFFVVLFVFFGTNSLYAQTAKSMQLFTQDAIKMDTSTIESKKLDADFKKRYTDVAFVYEFKTPEKNAWDRFKDWLANFFKNLFKFSDEKAAANFVYYFIRVVAIAIIVGVIYMLVKAIMNQEGQWIFGKSSDKKTLKYDEVERNLQSVDFEKLIASSLQDGNERLTIRYYYLWLLKKMAQNGTIQWDIEKTNSDYSYEIKNPETRETFDYLSYLYNNIWYGEFEMNNNTFEKAKLAFETAIKSNKHE